MIIPSWLTAFLDHPTAGFPAVVDFWRDVTGYAVSEPRGPRGEFVTFVPPHGDSCLKGQELADGAARIHVDLHVTDPHSAADEAIDLGARELVRADHHVVLTSPGGIVFCYVSHPGGVVPVPASWGDWSSRVDQICLDLPESAYESETGFWSQLLGAPLVPSPTHAEFARITPDWSPFRVLVQRLEEASGPARLHLDLATDDRAVETERHRRLGAHLVRENPNWTVLETPTGQRYCITDRMPWPR